MDDPHTQTQTHAGTHTTHARTHTHTNKGATWIRSEHWKTNKQKDAWVNDRGNDR